MKKLFLCFLLPFLFITTFAETNAIKIVAKGSSAELTREEIFIHLADIVDDNIPETYKYIQLHYGDIQGKKELQESMQVLVYLDMIENKKSSIHPNKKLPALSFYKLSQKFFGEDIFSYQSREYFSGRNTTYQDILALQENLENRNTSFTLEKQDTNVQKQIFSDVYDTLLQEHYDKKNLDEEKILYSAIQGLTEGTDDIHTSYFPPVENKDFQDDLDGSFEGIGAYVDLPSPGVFKIISPLSDSPAEKAGLRGGDRITHVDGKEILETHGLREIVSWVKGPAGTKVTLTVERKNTVQDIEVIRGKIVIASIESEIIKNTILYIKINTFGAHTTTEFRQTLQELETNTRIKKIIIDLRNNGGGYLDQVNSMLGYFIEKGNPTAQVEYLNNMQVYRSKGYGDYDFSQYDLVFLQNSGTASASEIMIGTLKDYYPESTIIGEKSYGKGSVQTIKSYKDGSSLKYTIAKWFTGKTKTGIDGIGITPDIILELDQDSLENTYDNQLQKAINIR